SIFLNAQYKTNRIGVGTVLWNDQVGNFNNTSMQAGFSYTVPLSKHSNLALGMLGGFITHNFAREKAIFANDNDPINTAGFTGNSLLFDAGLYYDILIKGKKRGAGEYHLYSMIGMKQTFVPDNPTPFMFSGIIGIKGKVDKDEKWFLNAAIEYRNEGGSMLNLQGLLEYNGIAGLGLVICNDNFSYFSRFGMQGSLRLSNIEENEIGLKLLSAFFFPPSSQLAYFRATTIMELGLNIQWGVQNRKY
ncbi:MAG: type IX secretion system membrane protein PorP/SprF, partial [Thermoflexibacteraceae bacterium]